MIFNASQFRARYGRALFTWTVLLLPWAVASGDESGVGFWLSGAYSSFAAVAPQTSFSMPTQFFYI
jgi:predicted membrane protein